MPSLCPVAAGARTTAGHYPARHQEHACRSCLDEGGRLGPGRGGASRQGHGNCRHLWRLSNDPPPPFLSPPAGILLGGSKLGGALSGRNIFFSGKEKHPRAPHSVSESSPPSI